MNDNDSAAGYKGVLGCTGYIDVKVGVELIDRYNKKCVCNRE